MKVIYIIALQNLKSELNLCCHYCLNLFKANLILLNFIYAQL